MRKKPGTRMAARAMRQLDLQEYVPSEHCLTASELRVLQREERNLDLSITLGADEGEYVLRPGSTVGAVEVGDLSVLIRPKIGIPQLLSLACYATDPLERGQRGRFNYLKKEALPDALALALVSAARRAFVRGLLHGYRMEEEALYTVRGRIRFDDQVRRRFGIPLPVEVRYDEFTDDIPANQLVKAAAMRLGGMRLRSPEARRGLGWVAAMLDSVSYAEFPSSDVPEVNFDRLNEHYRGW